MRYLVFFLGFIICQFSSAQDTSQKEDFTYEYKNVLKLSPFELGRAEFQVGFERYFNNRSQSLALYPSLMKSSRGEESKDGIQLMVQYRFYLTQLQRETSQTLYMHNIGFYTAPYLLGLTLKENYEVAFYEPERFETSYVLVEETVNAIEGGAMLGIQLDITRRIVLDFFVGGGIRESAVNASDIEYADEYGILEYGYTGVKPRIGFQMGITF